MKFFFDEDVTPALPPICHNGGYDATCARDRGLLDVDDDDIVAFCFEHDYVVVTGNARDFRWLCGNVELHPGLIVMPSLLKEEQLRLFPGVIDYIEEQAAAANLSPADFVVNRVVEMAEDGSCTHYDLPKPADTSRLQPRPAALYPRISMGGLSRTGFHRRLHWPRTETALLSRRRFTIRAGLYHPPAMDRSVVLSSVVATLI